MVVLRLTLVTRHNYTRRGTPDIVVHQFYTHPRERLAAKAHSRRQPSRPPTARLLQLISWPSSSADRREGRVCLPGASAWGAITGQGHMLLRVARREGSEVHW